MVVREQQWGAQSCGKAASEAQTPRGEGAVLATSPRSSDSNFVFPPPAAGTAREKAAFLPGEVFGHVCGLDRDLTVVF